jgi:predicted dithiol-disulfide oxidoreductase (DUF899 family)
MRWYDFPNQDDEYVRRRAELLAAEIALRDQIEAVAELRRQLPIGRTMPDYVFQEGPRDLRRDDPAEVVDVRFSELFGEDRDTLIVAHVMFAPEDDAPCVMCAMWADGYNAVAAHIEERAAFALVTKADIGQLRRWARSRSWDRIRLVSGYHNTFNRDLAFENEAGGQEPGVSVFTRTPAGTIHHRYSIGADFDADTIRGIDLYAPVWQLLDLLPQGRGEWFPDHSYMTATQPQPVG